MRRDHSLKGRLLLVLALLASGGCQTASLHNLDWFEMETPHFRIVSSLEPAEIRTLARDLELYQAGVEYIIGSVLPEAPRKTLVYAFDGRSIVRPFDVRGRSSYLVPDLVQPILVLRTGGGFAEDASNLTLHDYAHYLVRRSDRRRPIWYEEGVAQMASTIEPRGGHARVAPPRMDHVRTLRDWAKANVDPTLEATDLVGWTNRDTDRFIAESWALAHYATLAPKQRNSPVRPLARFRHALDNGAPAGQSARIAFDARGEELATALRTYVSGKSLNMASVTPREAWKPSESALTPLSRGTARLHLGQLSLALERPDQAYRYFRMASKEPEAPIGFAAAQRLRGNLDDARELALQAAKERPDDAMAALEAGRVFQALASEHPAERQAMLAEARKHYSRAFELDPELAAALAAHASTYLLEGEAAEQGIPLATAAYRQLPGSLEVQLLWAELEARRGHRSTAVLQASDVASRGHDLPVADAAQQLLDSLRETARSR